MSTQLILYPQNYRGRYNSTATPSFNEYVVNGVSFTGLNSTTLYSTTDNYPAESAIINSPASILGTWYRYATSGGAWGTVPPPLLSGSNVSMFTQPTAAHSGIYQQLSGLAIGGMYNVVINIATPTVGVLTIETYTGNVLQYNQAFSSNVSQITTTFTANSPNDIFLLDYESTTAIVEIGDISIQESPETVSNIYTDLEDGQVICDLYQEEDIPLTLSIDDFKNVAEKVQSYSKNFSLPATKRNNQIFNNMFEVTRADDRIIFNPYRKTQCVLKEDGFILFEGYLRLIDVKDKEGEISYNVNLYSEVIALADILKDQTFAELDFSELNHTYNKTSIKESWESVGAGQGLPLINPLLTNSFAYDAVTGVNNTQVLKYPFIDWTHQYLIGGTGSGNAATAGNPELTSLEQAFRPCIQLKYLINKIFSASGFTWTSNFFDTAEFGKLFMDFNWGADNAPLVFSSSGLGNRIGDQTMTTSFSTLLATTNTFPTELGYSSGVFTAPNNSQTYTISYTFEFEDSGGTSLLDVEWIHTSGSTVTPINQVIGQSLDYIYTGSFTMVLMAGDTLQCRAKADTGTLKFIGAPTTWNQLQATSSLDEATDDALLQTLRGELGQWDFLKGIMTMFNLVSMVDESNPDNLLIEPYSNVFINNTNSKRLDWTDKIDVSQMELKPLTDLNRNTIFKFVEDEDDYVFRQYKNSTSGHLYGSKEIDASGFTILEGTKEIIAEPFAATVSKPIDSAFPLFIVPSVYAMTDEGTSEGFENSPRIFYNNGEKDTGASYYIPAQNGLSSENQTLFLQFSHLSSLPPGAIVLARTDYVFESNQLFFPLGPAPINNLYNIYWSPYFNELYNADTRTMTLKVNLSPSDVSAFKFYDTVFIKNRVFRVNKIQYKPNDLATVEFILIP